MPTHDILDLLVAERDRLNRAIQALQGTPQRGTRGNSATRAIAQDSSGNRARRRRWTAAMREAARKRAKAVWVRRRKAAKKA